MTGGDGIKWVELQSCCLRRKLFACPYRQGSDDGMHVAHGRAKIHIWINKKKKTLRTPLRMEPKQLAESPFVLYWRGGFRFSFYCFLQFCLLVFKSFHQVPTVSCNFSLFSSSFFLNCAREHFSTKSVWILLLGSHRSCFLTFGSRSKVHFAILFYSLLFSANLWKIVYLWIRWENVFF